MREENEKAPRATDGRDPDWEEPVISRIDEKPLPGHIVKLIQQDIKEILSDEELIKRAFSDPRLRW